MHPTVADLVRRYAELEQRVVLAVPNHMRQACAGCEKVCCRPDVGHEAAESWWLRSVSQHVHGRWIPDDWAQRETCIAWTPAGCFLQAGRPLICHTYFCQRFLDACRDAPDLIVEGLFARLMDYVARYRPKADLTWADEDEVLQYADQIAARIDEAEHLLDLARRLMEAGAPTDRRRKIALELLIRHPGLLRPGIRRRLLPRLEAGEL